MIWDINTGYLKPLLSDNPEEKVEGADDKKDKESGGKKDYGF